MVKRKLSPTLKSSSPRKKVIVEPRFKHLSDHTLARIKRRVPSDVKVVKIYTDSGSKSQLGNMPQEDKVAFLIGVVDYAPSLGLHSNHAIAAYKWGNVLYCADPWGRGARAISKTIFKNLQELTGCRSLRIYKGANLQLYNSSGVCVGLASNFLTYMANRRTHLGDGYSRTIEKYLVSFGLNTLAQSLERQTIAISKRAKSRSVSPMNINTFKYFTSK